LEPALGRGVEPSDPDRFAAELGLLAGQPFVVAAFFSDYATRETMIDAVAAELQFRHKIDVRRVSVADEHGLDDMLDQQVGGVTFVLGLEDALPALAARLNAERDRLAKQHSVIWLPVDRFCDLASQAPALASIVIGPSQLPGLVGGVMPAEVLRPELVALEAKWGLSTADFLKRHRAGEATDVPEETAHRWAALAWLLG
jgi:hypothetical protein